MNDDDIVHLVSYENMLAEFLVNLGEELNESIPASLSEQIQLKTNRRTPSPALSSKTLSVQSVASQQEIIDSQRPTRLLRSFHTFHQSEVSIRSEIDFNFCDFHWEQVTDVIEAA